jgi:hypothetical protein
VPRPTDILVRFPGTMGLVELPDGEPAFGPWRSVAVAELPALLGHPRVLAVDGRSGSGKSTLVGRLVAAVPGAVAVHTDDVAWHHDFFDWADLLADGVLRPWRSGADVTFVPPGWAPRGRPGAIEVPATASLLVVEGVGASRRALVPLLDAAVWVQTDRRVGLYRGIARDGVAHRAFWTSGRPASGRSSRRTGPGSGPTSSSPGRTRVS